MTWRRAAFVLVLGAVFGFGVFGVLVWNATTVERLDADAAAPRFAAARTPFTGTPSLLVRAPSGRLVRREPPPAAHPGAIEELNVLSYRAESARLVEVVIPFWFFRLKAPAAQLMLRGTGFDLDELGLTVDELERHGPALLLDEATPDGDRLLVWTE